jgi:hypothetical protein
MIRRLFILLILGCLCHAPGVSAADVPFSKLGDAPQPVKPAAKLKKKTTKASIPIQARKANIKSAAETQQAVAAPSTREFEMSWVLGPLVAHADGGKREGSASAVANLVVTEPGFASTSYMTIELDGHVVKTAGTTARIDVRIGGRSHTVEWTADDIKSGRFKRTFKATLPEGKLPPYFPVSAIAFVTREREGGAVLVTLEKITVRVGDVVLAEAD